MKTDDQATQDDLQDEVYDEGADFDSIVDEPDEPASSDKDAAEDGDAEGDISNDGEPEGEPEGEPSGETEGEQESLPEWYEKLDDDARKDVDELLHARSEREALRQQYNALHGRLAPVQQQNAQLMQRLQQMQQGNTANRASQTDGQQAKPPTPQDLSGSEEFQQYKKDFPEEAAALEKEFHRRDQHIQNLQQQLQRVEQGFTKYDQQQAMQQQEQAYNELSSRHSDYQDCIQSEEYRDFLQTQPEEFRQIAMSTQDPATASWVLDQFKADLQRQIDMHEAQSAQDETSNEAQSIRARRKAALEQAAPSSGTSGLGVIDSGSEGSEADIFDSLLE